MIAPGTLELAVLTLAGAALVRYLFFTTPAIVPMPINEITHFAGARLSRRCQWNTERIGRT
jgi:hypothetical protein